MEKKVLMCICCSVCIALSLSLSLTLDAELLAKVSTVIPRLRKVIRSGITFVSRNVISRRFL
jgi:hypothetical protein